MDVCFVHETNDESHVLGAPRYWAHIVNSRYDTVVFGGKIFPVVVDAAEWRS